MKVLRLVVPSQITYTLNVLSQVAGVAFPNRQVVDVPLRDPDEYEAARKLAGWFNNQDGRTQLRNCPSAVDVFAVDIVDLP